MNVSGNRRQPLGQHPFPRAHLQHDIAGLQLRVAHDGVEQIRIGEEGLALLEEDVVPAFYERDAHGIPRRWITIVNEAIRTVAQRFSARRMVKDYVERMYAPALARKIEVGR